MWLEVPGSGDEQTGDEGDCGPSNQKLSHGGLVFENDQWGHSIPVEGTCIEW